MFLKIYLFVINYLIYTWTGSKAVDYDVPLDDDTVQLTAFFYNIPSNTTTEDELVTISEIVTAHKYPNTATTISSTTTSYSYKISNTEVNIIARRKIVNLVFLSQKYLIICTLYLKFSLFRVQDLLYQLLLKWLLQQMMEPMI